MEKKGTQGPTSSGKITTSEMTLSLLVTVGSFWVVPCKPVRQKATEKLFREDPFYLLSTFPIRFCHQEKEETS